MSDPEGPLHARRRSGYLFGVVAYTWWGLVPLYFAVLKRYGLTAGEILAQRICWSLPVLVVLVLGGGQWPQLRQAASNRRLLAVLLVSAGLLGVNWLLYIYATVTSRVAEASLGYFMMPLIHAALGWWVLGERLRPLHYPALLLVAAGVAIPFVAAGTFTWLAVALPVTFGLYSLVRKQAPVDSSVGLTLETLMLLGPSAAYLAWLTLRHQNHFGPDWACNLWIAASGVVTVVPLLAFTLSLRRLPLLAVSFLQFISPSVQMALAVTVLGESLHAAQAAAFGCVWLAVALFLADAAWQYHRRRKPRIVPVGKGKLLAGQDQSRQ